MEAFARAVALGYTHIETDVHATRDGVAVVHHDPTLARMTGETARIADLDWADLQRIRTLGGAAIPRADELLAAFPRLNITVELKCDRVAGPLAEVIGRADALNRVLRGVLRGTAHGGDPGAFGAGPVLVACAIRGVGAVAGGARVPDPGARFRRDAGAAPSQGASPLSRPA